MTKKSRCVPITFHTISLLPCLIIPQNIAEGVSALMLMFLHGTWMIYTASLLGRPHCNEFPFYRSHGEQENWLGFYIWSNWPGGAD